ncbi:unnamed protein product [Schistosoma mattheei]|uniref:Uncharacterized protein n=1 Tax=Schistosoma mattheei TaxID=31246 RepID=A0A183Q2U6_9TREM|nr:unnamed protein product [Schistosoma mattheei]
MLVKPGLSELRVLDDSMCLVIVVLKGLLTSSGNTNLASRSLANCVRAQRRRSHSGDRRNGRSKRDDSRSPGNQKNYLLNTYFRS